MMRALPFILACLMLSSCSTLNEIQHGEFANKVGSFQLNPVQLNSYWYNGKSYEYNEYQIEVTAEPVQAKVEWNGRVIGTTPFIYRFSGTLDIDDRVIVRAIPTAENIPSQEAVLRIRTELPRKIHFDLKSKNKY